MSVPVATACWLGVLVLLLASLTAGKRSVRRRLTTVAGPPEPSRSRDVVPLLAMVAGTAVALLVGGWWGIPSGVVVAVGTHRVLRRMEPAAVRVARLRAIADLPLAADLLAAALRAGAPTDLAADAVADALGGPLGERLRRVARSLSLGAEPAEAWAHLSDVTGADRLVAAAVRSSASGGALAGALSRLADDLRADRSVAAEAAARRAGVLIVLPLGLCFLPAFVLAGLVPVVVAVLGDVL
jgi:pilus assembly protein TadC